MTLAERNTAVRLEPVAPPKNKERVHFDMFAEQVKIYPVPIYTYSKVYVTGSGICFSRLLRLLEGSFMRVPRVKKEQWKIALFNFLARKKVNLNRKRYLVVHDQWYSGYYHWVMDCMPRLLSLEEQFSSLCLLLPEKARSISFIQETLGFFPNLEIYYLPSSKVAFVDQLVLPGHLPGFGMFDPYFLRRFRSFLKNNIPRPASGRRIYVTRKRASRRKVVNEKTVLDVLSRFGFEEVALEDFTFQEQVALFDQTGIVVTIHGAGLTNMLFMDPGSHVVELIKRPEPGEKYPMDYQVMASMFQLNYYCLLGIPNTENASLDQADLHINIDELTTLIKQVLE